MLLKLLLKRKHTYYFRWQFPKGVQEAIGKRELFRSLRTKDRKIAIHRAMRLYNLVEHIKSIKAAYEMNELTNDNYHEILKFIWELEISDPSEYSEELKKRYKEFDGSDENVQFSKPIEKLGGALLPVFLEILREASGAKSDIPEKAEAKYFEKSSKFRTIGDLEYLKDGKPYFDEEIEYIKKAVNTLKGGYENEAGYFDFLRPHVVIKLLRLGINKCDEKQFNQLLRDCAYLDVSKMESFSEEIENLLAYSPPSYIREILSSSKTLKPKEPTNPKLLLSNKWNEYVIDKKDSGKWKNDRKTLERLAEFNDFIELIGGDRECKDFTKEVAKEFRVALKKLPKNRKKLYGDTPLNEIPQEAELISDSTASQRLDNIKGLFKYLVMEGIITSNPFENIKIEYKSKNYATYSDNDLIKLFNLPKDRVKKAWQYWIPRLALYTGARQNEIAQLTIKDIKQDAATGSWYISINDEEAKTVKTGAAIRVVPIHSELIKHGLLDYVQELSKGNNNYSLWSDLKPKGGKLGQNVSRYWTELKNKHGILPEKTDHQGRRKVFHSLRRVFINKLKNEQVDLVTIQLLVGHEPDMGITGIYIDDMSKPVAELNDAIEKLNLDGIGWA